MGEEQKDFDLTSYVCKLTKGGRILAEFYLKVLKGGVFDGKKPSLKDRMTAAAWLGEHGIDSCDGPIRVQFASRVTGMTDEELKVEAEKLKKLSLTAE